jgi:hypothetical protein
MIFDIRLFQTEKNLLIRNILRRKSIQLYSHKHCHHDERFNKLSVESKHSLT